MAEERVPTGEATNSGQQPQAKTPNRNSIRKGNLTDLTIPSRQGPVNNHRDTRSTGDAKGVHVLPSKQEEREPRVRTTKDSSTSKKQEGVGKESGTKKNSVGKESGTKKNSVGKESGTKKNSKLLTGIFGLGVCFGGHPGEVEQRTQPTKERTSASTQKRFFTFSNCKGRRDSKKRAAVRPAGLKSSQMFHQDAARPSYDYSIGSNRNNYSSASGELEKGTFRSWSRTSSARKSVSKLRDYYIQVMLKMADASSQQGSGMGTGLGAHVDYDSRSFESEIFRKRSAQEADMVEQYFQHSIRPEEWNDAKLEKRIARHFSV